MNIINRWPLLGELSIVQVDKIPEDAFQALLKKNLLDSHPIVPWQKDLTEHLKEKHKALKLAVEGRFNLRLLLMQGESIVGLSTGWQDAAHTEFHMGLSVIEAAYRNKGLYSKMLDLVLSITREKGFSAVKSRHINTNNPILIAKLKKGFVINSFELDETMGPLLGMVYYHDDTRRRAANFRSGDIREKSIMKMLVES